MHNKSDGIIRLASEICYYGGLAGWVLFIPALTFIFWVLSTIGKADPNYWYFLLAWLAAGAVFVTGIALKTLLYSLDTKNNTS